MKKKIFCMFFITAFILGFAAKGFTGKMSSMNFNITRTVIAGGGALISSASYQEVFTLGQPSAIGVSSSSNFRNLAGFWPAAVNPVPPRDNKWLLMIIPAITSQAGKNNP